MILLMVETLLGVYPARSYGANIQKDFIDLAIKTN